MKSPKDEEFILYLSIRYKIEIVDSSFRASFILYFVVKTSPDYHTHGE